MVSSRQRSYANISLQASLQASPQAFSGPKILTIPGQTPGAAHARSGSARLVANGLRNVSHLPLLSFSAVPATIVRALSVAYDSGCFQRSPCEFEIGRAHV